MFSPEHGTHLDEVTDGGGAESREERRGAFIRYDVSAAGEEGAVLECGVDLYAGLDNIDG